jgi:hypothetical protein
MIDRDPNIVQSGLSRTVKKDGVMSGRCPVVKDALKLL